MEEKTRKMELGSIGSDLHDWKLPSLPVWRVRLMQKPHVACPLIRQALSKFTEKQKLRKLTENDTSPDTPSRPASSTTPSEAGGRVRELPQGKRLAFRDEVS